jgi:hypothetical protein
MSDLTRILNSPSIPEERPKTWRSRRLLFALIVVLTAGLAGVFVSQAVGQEGGFSLGP